MKPILNILFVEDIEEDTRLIVRKIQRAGFHVLWDISTTEDGSAL